MRFAFWLTHREIVVTGRQLIPKDKPVIFAANHQNALMDPLALAYTNPLQSVWLTRADIFKSKATRSFLKYLKMLPIYRIRDGKENLSNNEQIFAQVTQLLENKQSVALFPEAAHSGRRQMLPHKKAIPRIALEAEEKNNFGLDLQIVPVGIFYSHYWHFDRTLIVQYGEPIKVDDYREEYAANPQKAMLSLRDEIYNQLSPLVLQINSERYYYEYENIRQLAGKAYSKTRQFSRNPSLQLFEAEKELIAKIEQIEINRPKLFAELLKETNEYFGDVENVGLSDELVGKAGEARWQVFSAQLLAAILSLPLFVFGFVFNVVPFSVPRSIFRRKVKDTGFLSTFNFVVGLIAFPLFYLFAARLLFKLTDSLAASAIAFILMPFAGKYAYQLLVFYRHILYQVLFLAGSKSIKRLVNRRNELIESVFGMLKTN